MIKKKEKKSLEIFSLIGNVLFIPIIIFMMTICFFLLAARINNQLPTVFDNLVVRVLSGSMEPEYHRGDLIIVKKTTASDLETGDVIAFYRYAESEAPSVIWLHRIVDIKTNEEGYLIFQTKGDANMLPDVNWTREDYIIGKYNEKAVLLHRGLAFVNTNKGIALLIIIPAGIIFLYEGLVLINLIDECSKKNQKKRQHVSICPFMKNEIKIIPLQHERLFEDCDIEKPESMMTNHVSDDDKRESFKALSRKEVDLEDILKKIGVLRQRKKLDVRVVMKEAVKLERFKKKNFDKLNYEKNDQILDALNWCYKTIGKFRYNK